MYKEYVFLDEQGRNISGICEPFEIGDRIINKNGKWQIEGFVNTEKDTIITQKIIVRRLLKAELDKKPVRIDEKDKFISKEFIFLREFVELLESLFAEAQIKGTSAQTFTYLIGRLQEKYLQELKNNYGKEQKQTEKYSK